MNVAKHSENRNTNEPMEPTTWKKTNFDNNVVVEVLHLHPAPPKSVPQAGLATLASGQVASLRPRDQGHQQCEHVVHILQVFLIKATFDFCSPHLI